jgi:hypothetical protein
MILNSEQPATLILKAVLDKDNVNGQRKYYTVLELQITSKYLDIEKLTGKKQVRIDLCAYNRINDTIHFIETEPQLYVRHAIDFLPFCDFMHLCVPESSFQRNHQIQQEIAEQIRWAKKRGIGVLSVSPPDRVRVMVKAQRQKRITSLVRAEVYRYLKGCGVPIREKSE